MTESRCDHATIALIARRLRDGKGPLTRPTATMRPANAAAFPRCSSSFQSKTDASAAPADDAEATPDEWSDPAPAPSAIAALISMLNPRGSRHAPQARFRRDLSSPTLPLRAWARARTRAAEPPRAGRQPANVAAPTPPPVTGGGPVRCLRGHAALQQRLANEPRPRTAARSASTAKARRRPAIDTLHAGKAALAEPSPDARPGSGVEPGGRARRQRRAPPQS